MVRGMVVTQLQAHELVIPIVLYPQPRLLLRMIERFERGIRTVLTTRLTKANVIRESEAYVIEKKLGPNGRGLQRWKAYGIGAYSYKKIPNSSSKIFFKNIF
ncbi:unnamed protein product [Withania somnifera]